MITSFQLSTRVDYQTQVIYKGWHFPRWYNDLFIFFIEYQGSRSVSYKGDFFPKIHGSVLFFKMNIRLLTVAEFSGKNLYFFQCRYGHYLAEAVLFKRAVIHKLKSPLFSPKSPLKIASLRKISLIDHLKIWHVCWWNRFSPKPGHIDHINNMFRPR